MTPPRFPIALIGVPAALGLAAWLSSQTYQGTVVEAGSGEPIEDALFRGSPGGYADTRLADGVFEFWVPGLHRHRTAELSRGDVSHNAPHQLRTARGAVLPGLGLQLLVHGTRRCAKALPGSPRDGIVAKRKSRDGVTQMQYTHVAGG